MSFLSANPPRFGEVSERSRVLHLLNDRHRPLCFNRPTDVQLVWTIDGEPGERRVCRNCLARRYPRVAQALRKGRVRT